MAILKCKMCGGDIELSADKTFGTCEFCGSTMTFPKVDDEQRAARFNRGNQFRRIGEFDNIVFINDRNESLRKEGTYKKALTELDRKDEQGYAGMLEKMRGILVKDTKSANDKKHVFYLYDVLSGTENSDDAWYYHFFRNDIIFLGFGFDQSEEDIWWLITYRRQLMENHPILIHNSLIYLDTTPDSKRNDADEAKEKVLSAMGVKIIKLSGKTYREKYKSAINYLKNINGGSN